MVALVECAGGCRWTGAAPRVTGAAGVQRRPLTEGLPGASSAYIHITLVPTAYLILYMLSCLCLFILILKHCGGMDLFRLDAMLGT